MPPFAFEETTIAELQAAMTAGRLSSRRLTQAYLRRIRVRDFIARDTNARKGSASAAARAHTGRRTRTEPSKSQQKLAGL